MKPSEKQIKFCKTLQNILQLWIESNDINSPSHWTLIEETIEESLGEEIKEDDKELLIDAFGDLLTYIRTI